MTEEEKIREMCRSNYAAQMAGLGYGPDGMALPKKDKSEWVSVKDRLPEIGKVVLAFGTRSATTGMYQGTMANRPDVWMWKNHTPKHVSHWMPLPTPPRGGEAG